MISYPNINKTLSNTNFGRYTYWPYEAASNRVGSSFPFYMGMLFLIWKELGMGFFLMSGEAANKEKKNFLMNGLAGIVKEYFSMSGEAANGEILFHYDC